MTKPLLQVVLVVLPLICFSARKKNEALHHAPDGDMDLDAFLASLDAPANDPVAVVQGTNLDHAPHTATPPRQDVTQMSPGTMMHAEGDAILTEETVRDHEDQLHHTERHRMQCNKVMEGMGIGEQYGRTFEQSSMYVAEDRDIYADPNDERTRYSNGALMPNDPQSSHHLHHQECMKTKVHTVRKIAMLDELDLAPFLEKIGEIDIEGVAHAAKGDDAHFVEVQMLDPKSTRITLANSRTSSKANGWGLDTVKPDGIPNMDSP